MVQHNYGGHMTVEDMIKKMNDKADAMLRERERIIEFIEALSDGYAESGHTERAAACQTIVSHLRWKQ